MRSSVRVAQPPPRPLLVFDGGCRFCGRWIRRWQQVTGDAVEYLPAQDPRVAAQFPEVPCAQFDTAVQLIDRDGVVYSGAEAVIRTLARNALGRWLLRGYTGFPPFAAVTDRAYCFVAEHRSWFSRLTR